MSSNGAPKKAGLISSRSYAPVSGAHPSVSSAHQRQREQHTQRIRQFAAETVAEAAKAPAPEEISQQDIDDLLEQQDHDFTRTSSASASASGNALSDVSIAQVQHKLSRFSAFIDERLRPELQRVNAQCQRIHDEMSVYSDLKQTISAIQSSPNTTKNVETLVDLGCNFYSRALIPDASRILMAVGLGFYAEMTLEEAKKFIEEKMEQFQKSFDSCQHRASLISSHIKLVYEGMAELAQLTDKEKKRKPQW